MTTTTPRRRVAGIVLLVAIAVLVLIFAVPAGYTEIECRINPEACSFLDDRGGDE